jgi:hypothetical protein
MKWPKIRRRSRQVEKSEDVTEHEEQQSLGDAEYKLVELRRRLELLEHEGRILTRPRWLELRPHRSD